MKTKTTNSIINLEFFNQNLQIFSKICENFTRIRVIALTKIQLKTRQIRISKQTINKSNGGGGIDF